MNKGNVDNTIKVEYIEKYNLGEISRTEICQKLGVVEKTFRRWLKAYEVFGAANIETGASMAHYSRETKISAVRDYLDGKGSQMDICAIYKIRSYRQLRDWIKMYNGHKDLRYIGGVGSDIYMTKGRSTTLEERIDIVSYCIAHNKDFSNTVEIYGVSYQQIQSWVSKYEKNGVDGLVDRRGKKKSMDDMTEVERLCATNKLLQAEIEQKNMEIDLLKKLEELERRRR